jgi:hypothetical protein
MWGEVRLGSNVVSDTTGVIQVDGKEIVGLEQGRDGKALLDIDVWSSTGEHLAKLVKNSWVFGDRSKFDFVRTADHVNMSEKANGRVILDAALQQSAVDIAAADLYGPKGFHVYLDGDGTLHAGGVSLAGTAIKGFGKAIVVGSTGITIGQT